MANANDWDNIADEIRAILHDEAKLAQRKQAVRSFYDKNAFVSGDYLNGLADGDPVGDSGLVKNQVVSFVTFAGDYQKFLDAEAVGQADRRATVEQLRATK